VSEEKRVVDLVVDLLESLGEHASDDSVMALTQRASQLESDLDKLRTALDALIRHDIASDLRERIPNCLELLNAIQALEK